MCAGQARVHGEEGVFDHIFNPQIVRTGKPATHVQQLKSGKKLVLTGFPVFDTRDDLCLVVTFARDITLLAQLQDQVAGYAPPSKIFIPVSVLVAK